MSHLDVSIDADEAKQLLASMRLRLEGFQPVFEKARVELAAAFSANMMSSGSLTGGWPPEKPGLWSAAQGMPAVLHRTGALEASLSTLHGQPNDVGATRAVFGTSLPYAKFHQWGTEDMPSRRLVFEPPGFARKLASDVADHILPMTGQVGRVT
jgi:phage gpG-like protein